MSDYRIKLCSVRLYLQLFVGWLMSYLRYLCLLAFRDWPFNLQGGGYGFLFRFSDNTKVRIFFFCRAKLEIFFQNLTLGYMTKTLNQIIFFSSTKIRIFVSNIGNQNIFLEKKHNPPFKLNGRSLSGVQHILRCVFCFVCLCHVASFSGFFGNI